MIGVIKTIFSLFILLFGILFLIAFGVLFLTTSNSSGWPHTEGIVTGYHSGYRGIESVDYTYGINGVSYTGDAESPNLSLPRIGSRVNVYYNPMAPGSSNLANGFDIGIIVLLGLFFVIGIVFFGAGLLVFLKRYG